MALSKRRIHPGGQSPHKHEREAIDFALAELPDRAPIHAWPLQELLDPSTGQLLEIDLIVLGPHALYVVEIKSWVDGKLRGDSLDWSWSPAGAKPTRHYANPYRSANYKSKVLKGRLGRALQHVRVEALVFISSNGLDSSRLTNDARNHVITKRSEFVPAIVDANYTGAHANAARRSLRDEEKAIVQQLAKIGLRARQGGETFGSWELDELISSGPGYQEYSAKHATLPEGSRGRTARVRVYRRPSHEDTRDDRDRLRQLALREHDRLYPLRECPHVLHLKEFCENPVTHDPALAFEAFEDAYPFDSYLRGTPDLSFEDRLAVVSTIADALNACHRRNVLHRGLHPGAVLVRRPRPDAPLEVRLTHFQHARDFEAQTLQTLHTTSLSTTEPLLYRAPEILGGQDAGSPESDVFSLAAFAYFAFTGRHPAESPQDLVATVKQDGGLLPGRIQDDLIPLDPVFHSATSANPFERPTALDFREQLLEQLTQPDGDRDAVPPRQARSGNQLEGGYHVHGVLGEGASARVLEVERDGTRYALKVPKSDDAERALLAEAKVLSSLRHPSVIRHVETIRPHGLTCLLLGLAHPDTLADRLRQDGPLSLDLAHRYGANLCQALEHLESEAVTHRDIKPHNLGFTRDSTKQGKQKSQLILFDFSLSAADDDRVQLGTPAYRDPWLTTRGRWDAAADRYSAAITLHELLTGVRPDYGDRVNPAAVDDPSPRIDPTRFDSSVREGLVRFFECALAPKLEDRHESAAAMLHAWTSAFRDTALYADTPREPEDRPAFQLRDDLAPTTPLAAFVEDPLLLDALQRSSAETALDVARLPRNRLSAGAGVGKRVQNATFDLVTRLRERFAAELRAERPLLESFHLAPEPLLELTRDLLPQDQLRALNDQGIRTTLDLAHSSETRVAKILEPFKVRPTKIRRSLEAYQSTADADSTAPATLEGWLDLLLSVGKLDPKHKKDGSLTLTKTKRAAWAYLGLTTDDDDANRALGLGPHDPLGYPRTGEIAKALSASQPTVSNAIGFARDVWQAHPCRPALTALITELLEDLGGAATLPMTVAALCRKLARDPEATAPEDRRAAAALLRIVTTLRDPDDTPYVELGRQRSADSKLTTAWLGLTSDAIRAAEQLGAQADTLVRADDGTPEVPAFPTVRRTLEATALRVLPTAPPPEVLIPLAARSSTYARCSRKLELYPRDLPARATLQLAAGAIHAAVPTRADTKLTPEDVQALVRDRYPDTEPLPSRPELDDLLDELGLAFDERAQTYTRKGEDTSSVQATIPRSTRRPTATSGTPVDQSEAAIRARRFDENLRLAVEKQSLRIVQCLDRDYQAAIHCLAEFLDQPPISFDHLLLERIDALIDHNGISRDKITETDRHGPPQPGDHGPHQNDWNNLCRLAASAASDLLDDLASTPSAPRLVVHLGLAARYRLDAFLREWVRRCTEGYGQAVIAVVPILHGDTDPAIDGTVPIPITTRSQCVELERAWLANAHRAPAGAGAATPDDD